MSGHIVRLLHVGAEDLAALARQELASGRVIDPDEREALRLLGYPPLRLLAEGERPASVSPWVVDTREPCAAGHGDDEDCDLCRGECLGGGLSP